MFDFIGKALRTESTNFNSLIDTKGNTYSTPRLVHACFGMQTETAEFTDAVKKSLFYGKPLDTTNLKEELGDALWYIAIAMDELDTDFEEEMLRVIKKLRARYPDKFSDILAENRDLVSERKVLEHL